MIITKTCNTCEHFPNDHHCVGCKWDKSKGENTKWELKKNPIVIERKVLEQIREEIEQIDIFMGGPDYPFIPKKLVLYILDKYREEQTDAT